MTPIQQTLQQIAAGPAWLRPPFLADLITYLATGDPARLAAIRACPASWNGHAHYSLARAVAAPDAMRDEDRRALQVLAAAPCGAPLDVWLDLYLDREPPGHDFHAAFRQALAEEPATADRAPAATACHARRFARDGGPTSAGRYVLGLSDADLRAAIAVPAPQLNDALVQFLCAFAADRLPAVLDLLLPDGEANDHHCAAAAQLLAHCGPRFEADVVAFYERLREPAPRFRLACALFHHDSEKYRELGRAAALAALEGSDYSIAAADWLLQHFRAEAVPAVAAYVRRPHPNFWAAQRTLERAVQLLGREAVPVLVAAAETDMVPKVLAALAKLVPLNDGGHDAFIHARLGWVLGQNQARDTSEALQLLARCPAGPATEAAWGLLGHKSKPVRDAAARALAALGDPAVRRAGPLLADRKKDVRQAAVDLLRAANTAEAVALLEARLDQESDEGVRDTTLRALESVWRARGRTITRADVEARIARVAAKLAKPPVPWLDEARLPLLHYRTGEVVPGEAMRYLLYRQSRCREVRPDVEARPLFDLIDRATSGDFAREVLRSYLEHRLRDADDRWALTLAALLGDDRVAAVLAPQIREWAEGTRGKLAEFAVQALALQGGDVALLTIDSLATRYRNKKKSVGEASAEAFRQAAERQGLTPDELGDRVVPWLGFEPGKPRVIDCAGRPVRVRVGLDFKLKFDDLQKNKPVASLPKTAPKEAQAELKAGAVTLREVVKAQLTRLENLLVRQQRWPVARWRELFLGHPVLLPFAVRLVWGHYGADGAMRATFRALEDHTLTGAADESFALPDEGSVGMVHPLELTDEQRAAWQTHLADYEVEPPFAQLERPVVAVPPGEAGRRIVSEAAGAKVNGFAFRGRAEKLGWQRGAVIANGVVPAYVKRFPAAGIDAVLGVEDMYMGLDAAAEVTLQEASFVPAGTFRLGPYYWDAPRREDDEHALRFRDVPPLVYSEILGDLRKIAGKPASATAAEGPAA